MTNTLPHLKKLLSYLLISIYALCIQGCDYTQLADEELTAKLEKLELEKKEIEEAQAKKGKIKERIDKLIQEFNKADNEKADEQLEKLGKALYLSLKHDYHDKCQEIITLSQTKMNYTWDVVGQALNQALQDPIDDLHRVLSRLEKAQVADKKQNRKVLDFIVCSWLKEPNNIQDWKAALNKLYGQYPNVACYKFDKVIENFTKQMTSSVALKKHFEKAAKNDIIQQHQDQVLFAAIPLSLSSRNNYKLSTSNERNEGYYSDSEEENAPHFNGVYNFTKHGVYNIANVGSGESNEESYSPVRDNGNIIDNYVTDGEIVTPTTLGKEALDIRGELDSSLVTILCVALRQNDGRIKKFVFTTLPSVYQGSDTEEMLKKISEKAHQRGYHVIMAQQSHAEAEMMQFLQERPTRYTHIVAMGCDKPHCPTCHEMMSKLIGPNYIQLSANGVGTKSPNWYMPYALCNALTMHGLPVEGLKAKYKYKCGEECGHEPKCNTIKYNSNRWTWSMLEGKQIYKGHSQLTLEGWKDRPWKKKKKVNNDPHSANAEDLAPESDEKEEKQSSKSEKKSSGSDEKSKKKKKEEKQSSDNSGSESSEGESPVPPKEGKNQRKKSEKKSSGSDEKSKKKKKEEKQSSDNSGSESSEGESPVPPKEGKKQRKKSVKLSNQE